jgi:ribulose-5-phosphate 4-epimerase/fuculose-1-phosphate aldolase
MTDSNSVNDGLARLALACRILEMEGHGDMTLGHLSWRDPEGRGFWMKRNRAGLGEILGPEDFVLLDFDGRQHAGSGKSHSEWPIHSEILLARPDVAVVAHTHPLHASILSASSEPLRPYTLEADYFAAVPRHHATSALITTKAMGQDLAAALGPHFAVFLANHGVTFCGTSVEHATCVGVFLEKACKVQLLAAGAGLAATLPSDEERRIRHGQIMTPVHVEHSWSYFCRKLAARAPDTAGKPTPLYS